MAREYQNGDGFGYILAFRREGAEPWTVVRVPHVDSSRYVHTNSSLSPYSPFQVKIQAYNRRGEGPFSQIAVVHSAEEGNLTMCCCCCWLVGWLGREGGGEGGWGGGDVVVRSVLGEPHQ